VTTFKRTCKECGIKFDYGDIDKPLSGQMTRKFCDLCKIQRHREESKLYQCERRLRLGQDKVNIYNRRMYRRKHVHQT
jgi:hypothetical protein